MISEAVHMDNMEYMAKFPDKFFDLAIVDPPYGISADIKNSTTKKQSKNSASNSKSYGNQQWDSHIPSTEYFNELKRVSKHQIIWGANYFGLSGGFLYWDKCVTMPTYSDGELAYCSLINSVKSFKYAWHGMIQQNMKNKEIRMHPTQKPVALYCWVIKSFAKDGFKILDTHLGSGSSRIAAYDLGFDFYSCELDREYFESQEKRFSKHISQQQLFTPTQHTAEQLNLL